MINYFQLLGYALIPAATMTLAGIWATLRVPGENTCSALMHFAAGVVFAVVAVEFLPDLVHEHSVLATAVGFTLGTAAMLGGCRLLPSNHVFNTAIDALPVHPSSATLMATIGTRNLHLDLGRTVDQQSATYYGIPYNIVRGSSLTWSKIAFYSADPSLNWDPRPEADCASGAAHTLVSPCIAASAPSPLLPIPSNVLVEGGVNTAASQLPYGDHHILVLDADTCRLWETFHSYPDGSGGWNIFGAATWDLRSNALRPPTWTSADGAGFGWRFGQSS